MPLVVLLVLVVHDVLLVEPRHLYSCATCGGLVVCRLWSHDECILFLFCLADVKYFPDELVRTKVVRV